MDNRFSSISNKDKILNELNSLASQKIIRSPSVYQRMKDPALLKFYYYAKNKSLIDRLEMDGSSPPDIFVGRLGYPHVFIGPLIPPTHEDTSLLGTPEQWVGRNIQDIIEFRMQMVRGMHKVKVTEIDKCRIAEMTQELALAKDSSIVEAEFTKKPYARIRMNDETQPYGPSAPLKAFKLSSTTANQRIEKMHSDTDLKAKEAVINLYEKEVLVSKIQKAFSAGLFGLKKNRKFVPTRWSITAVDSMLSLNLLDNVKQYPLINEYRVYEFYYLDNRWLILMVPGHWSYEQMEAWYPRTIWNMEGKQIVIYSDYEGFDGRKTYAATGGCYYSTRLAIGEHLVKEGRQATVITFREVHPGLIMPLGVWLTRESVRQTFRNNSMKFDELDNALKYIASKLSIPMKEWVKNSFIIRQLISQKRIFDFTPKKEEKNSQ